jgi:hypothetical protein
LQFINNWSYGEWDGLAYFSIAFSLFNSISGIYRIFYYKVYLKVPLAAIPVDFQVYGMYVFGTEVSKNLLGDDVSDDSDVSGADMVRWIYSVWQSSQAW